MKKTRLMRQTFLSLAATLILTTLPFVVSAQNKKTDKIAEKSGAPTVEDDEVISIDTNLIVANAVVTDAQGNYLSGLRQKDFQVFENGKLQQIEVFAAENSAFAAVILLDTSGSMETRMSVARSAAIKFLDGLRGDDVAALYNFDSKVELVQEFSQSRDLPFNAFDLKARGMTVLNDAIATAANALATRPEKRRAIIVLSDGADTQSKLNGGKALQAALRANAVIYTVDMSALDGANDRARMQSIGALKNFAEKSGGRFVAVAGGAEMRDAFRQIIEELGAQYTLGYQSTNSTRDGKWRAIEIKINSKSAANIRARKGYNAAKQ